MFLLAKYISILINSLFIHTIMNYPFKVRSKICLVVALFLASSSLHAQTRIKLVDEKLKPDFEALLSPEFNSGNNDVKNWRPKSWLEMHVEFEIDLTDPKDSAFVDKITVKWYVAAKDLTTKKYILMEKEVEHINVPVGEQLYTSIYLSPAAIMRLTGSDRASERVIERVGGEILYNGQRVGYFSSKDKAGWWQSGELSRYDKIPLRSKNETPFHYFWWDKYAENKVERR